MSETVKLIIEMPKKEYEAFKELIAINISGRGSGKGLIYSALTAVKNGTPLDKVLNEIKAEPTTEAKIKEARDTLLRLRHEVGYIRKKDIEDSFAGIVEDEK